MCVNINGNYKTFNFVFKFKNSCHFVKFLNKIIYVMLWLHVGGHTSFATECDKKKKKIVIMTIKNI